MSLWRPRGNRVADRVTAARQMCPRTPPPVALTGRRGSEQRKAGEAGKGCTWILSWFPERDTLCAGRQPRTYKLRHEDRSAWSEPLRLWGLVTAAKGAKEDTRSSPVSTCWPRLLRRRRPSQEASFPVCGEAPTVCPSTDAPSSPTAFCTLANPAFPGRSRPSHGCSPSWGAGWLCRGPSASIFAGGTCLWFPVLARLHPVLLPG